MSFFLLCCMVISMISCNEKYPDLDNGLYAEFVTNKGTFVAELYYKATPVTVGSFVALAEGKMDHVNEEYKNKPFYNGLKFHRVIKDFMIQGGDPLGTGSGDPGYKFPDEIVDSLQHDSAGILSMANSGPNTNGSQFFVTLKETPWLNGMHTVFGKVVMGMDVVEAIGAVETTKPGDKPVQDVVINELNIIRKGTDAKGFDASKTFNENLEKIKKEKEERLKAETEAKQEAVNKHAEMEVKAEDLRSGLKIFMKESGDGEKPQLGQTVLVNYAGYLKDGTLFDTNIPSVAKEAGIYSEERENGGGYNPMPAKYGPDAPLIAGFKEGIQQMKVGDKAVLFIPPHLGYGTRGAGNVIPPNSELVFEIELVGIQ
ncbi:MAG TPA: peptidylprolyl isomerase [Salinimicrobium sp.]|nr:peptidylprolyl isomerase [Salinimicrobium sp.]